LKIRPNRFRWGFNPKWRPICTRKFVVPWYDMTRPQWLHLTCVSESLVQNLHTSDTMTHTTILHGARRATAAMGSGYLGVGGGGGAVLPDCWCFILCSLNGSSPTWSWWSFTFRILDCSKFVRTWPRHDFLVHRHTISPLAVSRIFRYLYDPSTMQGKPRLVAIILNSILKLLDYEACAQTSSPYSAQTSSAHTAHCTSFDISRTYMAVVLYARHLRLLHVCMQEQLANNLFVHYTLRAPSSAAKCRTIPRPKSHCAQRHPNYWAVRHFTRLLEKERVKFLKIGTLLWRRPHTKNRVVPKSNGMAKLPTCSKTFCNGPAIFGKGVIP